MLHHKQILENDLERMRSDQNNSLDFAVNIRKLVDCRVGVFRVSTAQ